MLLKDRNSGQMLAVEHVTDLFNLNHDCITGRFQYGEEEQDPETFRKADLVFLSGEELPRCWTDPHYRDSEMLRYTRRRTLSSG
ncbi:MAG: acetyltransferase [Gammaproteobacteria bacterium]|nr:acetyltransferase [Gammaproteobacteria bacterium]